MEVTSLTGGEVKIRYSKKATKIWKFKKIGRFFQIFVAFTEYLNFKCNMMITY